ncbi:MAG: hypothetical protein A2653_03050 [Candidatus Zambryskibacteria bacterium RIFCSPHIGHO2_01_FULL_43_25]|uniref:Uncharacterized protein n=1 Tax=Candidatus Zambryskibacteria bacterium RIFCSPLOWO2_01_FULL_45_21 TaxID=1802761 RepID=A0A1G2U2F4_9BACT|nr:MAG: hypothetical protein A2653_03050 [Candidatus Zambryskibacteria bacterium RIFCSPHIGHO2_01_FULL_43_25]OHB00997.1 MAG: hypothetical protein A3E94_02295 [Candidatus Zambryskibacteria bacterium RIFCSPHIGHO2_12_FULL_44_12b]OHB03715.1 MAG: hypothetical protein A3B14_01570 [Candidatus Zambryskibacteria bacterium RIFCSPLOWO2_01_FULL_45_21]
MMRHLKTTKAPTCPPLDGRWQNYLNKNHDYGYTKIVATGRKEVEEIMDHRGDVDHRILLYGKQSGRFLVNWTHFRPYIHWF